MESATFRWPPLSCLATILEALLALLVLGASAFADDTPTVTPYRPSVSTPAAVSTPGWLEVEFGGQRGWASDPLSHDLLPYTFKLAFTPEWAVRIGGYVYAADRAADGTNSRGVGDTGVVLKRFFGIDDTQAVGLEFGVKLPTAKQPLGSGHTDYALNGIYSADFAGPWHIDVNLATIHVGGTPVAVSPWQAAWSAALSRNFGTQWNIVGELSGMRQSGTQNTAQFLLAPTYYISPAVAVDFGASWGLNAASGHWTAFAGVTFLAVKLF